MKKYQLNYVLLAISFFFSITSCTKETINTNNVVSTNDNYSIKTGCLDWCGITYQDKESSNWICFNSIQAYEDIVEQYSNADKSGLDELSSLFDFNSMAKAYSKSERDSLGVTDDFFASILSANGIIQIEDYVLHMDFVDSTVQILCLSDSLVLERNTDFDFFAFLDNLENEGKGGHYRYNEAEHQVWVEQDVDPDIPGLCTVSKLKYEKFVVYFCISTVVNNTFMPNWFGGGHFGDMYISGAPDIYIYAYNGNPNTNTGYYTTNKRNATRQYVNGFNIGGYGHTYSKKVYSGIRGLKEFNIKAQFAWNQNSGYEYGSKTLTITKTAQ